MDLIYQIKAATATYSGLSRDALHIHIGLLVFFGACLLFKWKASQPMPWLAVLAVSTFNEASDLYYHYAVTQRWLISESVHDTLNTMFLPTLIMFLARWTTVFARPEKWRITEEQDDQ